MKQGGWADIPVLLAGAKGHGAHVLRTVLSVAGVGRVTTMEDARRALELLCTQNFDAVFVEEMLQLDGVAFAVAARRAHNLRNPLIPIFAVYGGARRRDVEKARDVATTGVVCRPISAKTIADKLRLAFTQPRPFITAPNFFGPDRRSKTGGTFSGRERRKRAARKTKVRFLDGP